MIIKLLLKALGWLKEHVKEFLAVALGIGVAAAADGAVNAHKAKKINKKAIEIQEAAIHRHSDAYEKTQTILLELGKAEKTVIDSFERFADTMEQIKGRPHFKNSMFSAVKVPNYEPEEMKILSADLQMAIAGVGGAGVGALAGLAAFGAGAIIAAPAALCFGFVLCTKGTNLKKKAVENIRQANKLSKDIDEVIAFYGEVDKAVIPFTESMWALYSKYDTYLKDIDDILVHKSSWKEFDRQERLKVKNSITLAQLLFSMCQTKIIERHEAEGKLETVNASALTKFEKQAYKLVEAV